MRKPLLLAAAALVSLAAPTGTASLTHLGPGRASPAAYAGVNGRIVFDGFPSSSTPYEEIYIVNSDGSGLQRLTNNNGARVSDVQPDWAPNGHKFVFTRQAYGTDSELVVMNANGDVLDRLTSDGKSQYNANWSPDGTKIAYTQIDPGLVRNIYVLDLATHVKTQMTTGGADYAPRWSPDGTKLLFNRDIDAGGITDILTVDVIQSPFGPGTEQTLVHTGAWNAWPDWAPSGNRIVFARASAATGWSGDIFVYDLRTDAVTRVTRTADHDTEPVFAPDGKKVVYASDNRDSDRPDDLVVKNLVTGDRRLLTTGADRYDESPDWGIDPTA